MSFSAVIVAAGTGSRAGGPKQWRELGGRPVLRWSAEALLAAGASELAVVVAPGAEALAVDALTGLDRWFAVAGGATRADSVQAGLNALAAAPDTRVLIHDAARPLLDALTIGRVLAALDGHAAALPVLPVADSLRRGVDEIMGDPVDREGLWRAQTPQGFRLQTIRDAYAGWTGPSPPTDDVEVARAAGHAVAMVAGDPRLLKLTFPEDITMAEALLPRRTRVGQGFDAHRWGPGSSVWLCGVEIAHDQTLIGHSDADAGLHALTDAILGALGEGDIGDHFPPSDRQWKGASSDRFLTWAAGRVAARGGRIANVDVTLICEQPRVKPHREAMRARLAEILAVAPDAVSVKATTTEGMGFTGRGEGLAAQAVVSIDLPA